MLEARWTRVMSGRGETSAYKRRTLGGWRAENKRDWGRLEHLLWGLGSFEVRREILILQGMPINGESEFAGMVQSARVPSPESPSAWHALCLPQQGPRGICFFFPAGLIVPGTKPRLAFPPVPPSPVRSSQIRALVATVQCFATFSLLYLGAWVRLFLPSWLLGFKCRVVLPCRLASLAPSQLKPNFNHLTPRKWMPTDSK